MGREDDILNVGGYKIAPGEIEDVLLGHEAVAECAVVAVDTAQRVVELKAYVCVRPGFTADRRLIAQLRRRLRNHLSAHKCPRRFEFLETLPRTSTGKLARRRLREPQLLAGDGP